MQKYTASFIILHYQKQQNMYNFDADRTRVEDSVKSHLLNHENALAYILGGKATFTLVGRNNSITYKVNDSKRFNPATGKQERFPNLKFINVKIGHTYIYMGTIRWTGTGWDFVVDRGRAASYKNGQLDKAERLPQVTPSQMEVVAFNHVWSHLWRGNAMPSLEFWATGTCCRCGKRLTQANSIADAMGPVCHKKHKELLQNIGVIVAQKKIELNNH